MEQSIRRYRARYWAKLDYRITCSDYKVVGSPHLGPLFGTKSRKEPDHVLPKYVEIKDGYRQQNNTGRWVRVREGTWKDVIMFQSLFHLLYCFLTYLSQKDGQKSGGHWLWQEMMSCFIKMWVSAPLRYSNCLKWFNVWFNFWFGSLFLSLSASLASYFFSSIDLSHWQQKLLELFHHINSIRNSKL